MERSDALFALYMFCVVLWLAFLTLILPRILACTLAFFANRALARRAHISLSALYCYPLAGRFVAHGLVYVDGDLAVTLGELVVVWRWWRRGRLTSFEVEDHSPVQESAEKGPLTNFIQAIVRTATTESTDAPAALLSFVCSGLRVRLISMRANYDLLERLRRYASSPGASSNFPQFSSGTSMSSPAQRSQSKSEMEHLLEMSSLKIKAGALFVCDHASTPLARVLFESGRFRYRHFPAPSSLDLFRYAIQARITGLHISVSDRDMLRSVGVMDEGEDSASVPELGCMHHCGTKMCRFFSSCCCFGGRSSRQKHSLPCIDILRSDSANLEYTCDEPGPDTPYSDDDDGSDDIAPPELKLDVNLDGTSFAYSQTAISCLQDLQERLFPRLFDLTEVAADFQSRMKRRMHKCFVVDVTASAYNSPKATAMDEQGQIAQPLLSMPFLPRQHTWRLLHTLGINRSRHSEFQEPEESEEHSADSLPPDCMFAVFTRQVSVHTEIPYKLGDPLLVTAQTPDVLLCNKGVVDAPICSAKQLELEYEIKFPRIWNDKHEARLGCTVTNGEFTYMPDLIRSIDDLTATVDSQSRKPPDIRYFVPSQFLISIKAVGSFTAKLAASRGNAWADIYSGIADDYGMAVIKGDSAELTLTLKSPLEYLPTVTVVEWGLRIPQPSLYLSLPCPQSLEDAFANEGYRNQVSAELSEEARANISLAQRVFMRIEGANMNSSENFVGGSLGSFSDQLEEQAINSNEGEEPVEQVLIKIIEILGECTLHGRVVAHEALYPDGISENRVSVRLSGILFDMNPHHLQHLLNVITNCSAFMNHTLTAEEKRHLDNRRQSLAHDIIGANRTPTFDECIILGTECGISLAASAHNLGKDGPPRTAMDEVTTVDLEIDGGCLVLHSLPDAISSFSSGSSQVCSLDVGQASFVLTSNHKEMISHFSPIAGQSSIKLYPGEPHELRANILRRLRNRPSRSSSLSKYPELTLTDFSLTRQVLYSTELGAYSAEIAVEIGKVEGCLLESTLMAIVGFGKGVHIRPAYEEAPVMDALVGVQSVQLKLGRTDVLILCGAQASGKESSALERKPSREFGAAVSGRGSFNRRQRGSGTSIPAVVAGIAQLRMREGVRLCMSNYATAGFLSRIGITVPDLSVQLFTPWGGSSTPWIDETTLRAQVSHASAIKAWRQVGVQQGRAVMHKAGVFENFVLRVVWDTRPSLWSKNVSAIQVARLQRADKYSRRSCHLWEELNTTSSSRGQMSSRTVLETYYSSWWEFLECVSRRERSMLDPENPNDNERNWRRDVVSVFVLSDVSLSIGPEALELAYYIATEARSRKDDNGSLSDLSTRLMDNKTVNAADLIEIWRDLNAQSACSENHDKIRHENSPSRSNGTVVQCNFFLSGASVILICPFLAEEPMDRARVRPVIVREESLTASFPRGCQLVYRWRSERGGSGAPSLVPDVMSSPNVPYSLSLRQSALMSIPLIVLRSSRKTVASFSDVHGRAVDSVAYRKERKIGRDVFEHTHRGRQRVFDLSVDSCKMGKPDSDLESYSELFRVISIYGLMFRALALDASATVRWRQDRRSAMCESLFSVPFYTLQNLSPAQVQALCFAKLVTLVQLDRYPTRERSHGQSTFLVSEELETNFPTVLNSLRAISRNRPAAESRNSVVTSSVSLHAAVHELVVNMCSREAFAIRECMSEAQMEVSNGPLLILQEAPVARVALGSVTVSLRDDVADAALQTVSSVASYIRFAAAYIPMLRYEVTDIRQGGIEAESFTVPTGLSSDNSLSISQRMSGDNTRRGSESSQRRRRNEPKSQSRFKIRRHGVQHDSTDDMARGKTSRHSQPRSPRTSRHKRVSVESSSPSASPAPSPGGHRKHLERGQKGRYSTLAAPRSGSARSGWLDFQGSSSSRKPENTVTASTLAMGSEDKQTAILELEEKRSPLEIPPNAFQPSSQSASHLINVLDMYKAPRRDEMVGPKIKKVAHIHPSDITGEEDDDLDDRTLLDGDDARVLDSVVQKRNEGRNTKTRGSASRKDTGKQVRVAEPFPSTSKERSENQKGKRGDVSAVDVQSLGDRTQAATVIFSVNNLEISYFRRESLDLHADMSKVKRHISPDLTFTVNRAGASVVVTPYSASQSVVATVDGASLTSKKGASCVLEGSVSSINAMISIAPGTLPSDPKKIICSSRTSDLHLSLHAKDVRSVLAFREKFKKDLSSLAGSALSTRTSIAAMARATKLENLTKPSVAPTAFSVVAIDLSFENFKAALHGFHPADKAMQISYEVDGIFGSMAAMENHSVTLKVGGLIYGHGLALSSPSWPAKETFNFPALDARGVQWAHTTGLPTQVKVTTGPLLSATSFQGLRHVLFAISGLLAFQNKATQEDESDEFTSSETSPEITSHGNGARKGSSASYAHSGGAPLNRSILAWEATKSFRLEYSLKPMSIRLGSGEVMAAFDIASIGGVVKWNKLVSSGNQLQAVLQVPRFSVVYTRLESPEHLNSPEDVRTENSSLLVSIQDVCLDVLKSQSGLTHNFIFRVNVGSVSGQLRPWRFMSDAAVWANEQDVVQELQAVNYDAAVRSRGLVGPSAGVSEPAQTEHRVITVGVEFKSVRLAVPLLDLENSENCRLGLTATEVHFLMRFGSETDLPSQRNLAQIRSRFIGVVWEDSAFLSAHHARMMFAAKGQKEGKNAHFGAIRGSASTETWIVCPRKDVVLAFIDAKCAPENHQGGHESSQQKAESSPNVKRHSRNRGSDSNSYPEQRQLFESVEFMILPSPGYIRGLESTNVKNERSGPHFDGEGSRQLGSTSVELSIPCFTVAWYRHPLYNFDLVDVDFSGKRDEFPEGCLRKAGNIFSELFGAVATSTGGTRGSTVSERQKSTPRQITRDWSALIRFGESRYVARESAVGNLNSKFEFYAGKHAGVLASVAANPRLLSGGSENATVITGGSPMLSLQIRPALENVKTQCLELSYVRFLQGYAPAVVPHTLAHVSGVNATMDVMTGLLVREWVKRNQALNSNAILDTTADYAEQRAVEKRNISERTAVLVLGRPARFDEERKRRSSHQETEASVRIMLQLSQPEGRVGLLVQRLHVGLSQEKVYGAPLGYNMDVRIGLHCVESRADWEYLSCSFQLSRLLFRFETQKVTEDDLVSGFAAIVNRCEFDFRRGDIDALSLKIDGIASACRVPDRDLAVQTTTVDCFISSSTGKTIQRLLQLAARLTREARRQIESMVLTDARLIESHISFSMENAGSSSGYDMFERGRMLGAGQSSYKSSHDGARDGFGTGNSGLREDMLDLPKGRSATAYLSGDRLAVTMHGYRFEETSGAQLEFLHYELDYKQKIVKGQGSSEGPETAKDMDATRRELNIVFDLLDVRYSGDGPKVSKSILRMPNPMLEFLVVERGNHAQVDFSTKFEKEIEISSSVSHYEYLHKLAGLYTESRMQVASTVEQLDEAGDLRLPIRRRDEPSAPFGGREIEIVRLVLSPRLQPLGELTPDINVLERFGLKMEAVPGAVYDFVMMPIANVLNGITKSLL